MSWSFRVVPCIALVATTTAASAQAVAGDTRPPVITAFHINGGADRVRAETPSLTLNHDRIGLAPSEYRVSHRADFGGASWMPYDSLPALSRWFRADAPRCNGEPGTWSIILYLQVRAVAGSEFKVVGGQRTAVPRMVESNVARDSICAAARS